VKNKKREQTRDTNPGIMADTAYRAEDATHIPNAEPGFDVEGRGLGYVTERPNVEVEYKEAQKTPTRGVPGS
jgi:hypothetical protein